MTNGKYAHKVADIPPGEHWVILTNKSIAIPGDERSRTNPGHGYPASTEHVLDYEVFTDKAVFEAELARRLTPGHRLFADTCVGIHVLGRYEATVTVSVAVAERS